MTKTLTFIIVAGVTGAIVGGGMSFLLTSFGGEAEQPAAKPIYWVAPMDPSYRRDQPGQSPMGMDLVAVYSDQDASAGEGVVSISPVVENNLGVRTGNVELGPFKSSIRTVGYVRFDEDRLIHMHPRIEGWIEELNVKTVGDFIENGQPIYSIYSPELVSAQEELLLAMNRDNQRLGLVQSAEERLLALQVPQSLIDQIKSEKSVFRNVTVYAPQGGVVAELGVREGQFVQPGNPILSIGVLDEVWVIAEVFERQVSLVSEGDSVVMTLDYLPAQKWQGVVDFIYPTLDADTRTVAVRLRFSNPDRKLKPNMFAQITIQHSEEDELTLLVPNESIIRSGVQDRVVMAMGEGKFKSVNIASGRRGDSRTEILQGLNAGDRVVTSAHFLLDSESSITSDFLRMSPREELPMDKSEHQEMNAIDHSEHQQMNADESAAPTDPAVHDH
ncbi:MAG: Cu(I)/Ag(I) efflux system membrane fusion protein [Pseudohongiellaceae bacterium]|jgi:Cu(I)/Ag(I) efflux system membrane fusion protein